MQVDLANPAKQRTEGKFAGFRKIQQLPESIHFSANLDPDKCSRTPHLLGGLSINPVFY